MVSSSQELGTLGVTICIEVAADVHEKMKDAANVMSKITYVGQPNKEHTVTYKKKYLLYK